MNATIIPLTSQQLAAGARILKVMAHPVKLEILQTLGNVDAMDVSSICQHISSDCEISMMSHHLSKMRDNGILVSEKKGKRVFYSLADRSLMKLIACLSQCDLI